MSKQLRRVSLGTDFNSADKRRARAYGACVCCGIEKVEHCDHAMPLEAKGASTWENLIPLCASCHARKSIQQDAITSVKVLLANVQEWLNLKENPAPINLNWLKRMESNKRAGEIKRHLVERDRKAKKASIFNHLEHHPLKEG